MLTRVHPALDRAVVLFQDVIKVLHRSMSTVLFQNTVGFELYDGWRISSVLVGIDYPRRRMVCSAQRFGSESAQPPLHRAWPGTLYAGDYCLAGLQTSFAVERKSYRLFGQLLPDRPARRFERELHRLRGYRFKWLLVVGTREDIAAGHYHSRIEPKAVLARTGAFEVRYDLPMVLPIRLRLARVRSNAGRGGLLGK